MRITFEGGSDHAFRSNLERDTAAEMDRLGVEWRYEVAVTLPTGSRAPYLPDFTIDSAPDALRLPTWVECKPQQMLYELRDTTGVTRKAGEYFKADVTVEGVTASHFMDYDLQELAKPKRLAELTGESVLVIGGVGGTSSLTALLTESTVVFSRCHSFANQRGAQKAAERAEREARWAIQSEEYRKQHAAEQVRRLQEQEAQRMRGQEIRKKNVRGFVTTLKGITPKFSSQCHGCLTPGTDGLIYRVTFPNGERWERVCDRCAATA